MRVEGERRYALLLAARDSDYVRKVYGGYFNVFVEAFGEEGDRWDLFRVVDGEFPDAAELCKYQGFVVSGSPHDAYADDLWILRLCVLLQGSALGTRLCCWRDRANEFLSCSLLFFSHARVDSGSK